LDSGFPAAVVASITALGITGDVTAEDKVNVNAGYTLNDGNGGSNYIVTLNSAAGAIESRSIQPLRGAIHRDATRRIGVLPCAAREAGGTRPSEAA
jgi:hypothetical protein